MFKPITIILIPLLFFQFGCSHVRDEAPGETKDLVEVFDLEKAGFDRFKIESVEDVAPPLKKAPEKIGSTKKSTPSISTKKEVRTEKVTPSAPVKAKSSIYPADYPDQYKVYDKKFKKTWAAFKPNIYIGEQHKVRVKYIGVTAGDIVMTVKAKERIDGQEAYSFYGRMQSADYYSMIYSLDDSIHTHVSVDTFLPIKYTLRQRESSQKVDDLQLFSHDELKTYYWYKKVKNDRNKDEHKITYIPKYFQDSFSPLYFMRGFPMKQGEIYEFPVVTRGKVWLLRAEVAGIENIEVMDQKISAIKVKAETRFPGVLKKRGDILFWYSNDEFKKFLKFEAKVKIGSVEGELIEYVPGKLVEQMNE